MPSFIEVAFVLACGVLGWVLADKMGPRAGIPVGAGMMLMAGYSLSHGYNPQMTIPLILVGAILLGITLTHRIIS